MNNGKSNFISRYVGGIKAALLKASYTPGALSLLFNPFHIMRSRIFKSLKVLKNQIHGSVLDVGCGSKPYLDLFSHVDSYIGIDVETSGHNHITSKIDLTFDGKSIPFQDETFDCVVSFEVFEHVFEIEGLLIEIKRVLARGGLLLVTTPFVWPEHEQPFDFARYSSFGLEHLLKRQGFEPLAKIKTGNETAVLGQLWINTVLERTELINPLARIAIQLILIFPITCLVEAVVRLARTKNPSLYLGNVFLLRKI